jgi:uncharacterized protein (TIGR02118 family)
MVKFFFVLRRKPEMSAEEFHRHWKTVHAPLVARLPGLVRYFQHHVVSVPRPEYAHDDAPIDGLVETWWESEESLRKIQASSELQTVLADEKVFMGASDHFVHTLRVLETVEVVSRPISRAQEI